MNRPERVIVERIDRDRERLSTRQARTARQKALEAQARAVIAEAFVDLNEDERADFLCDLIAAGRELLVQLVDAPFAASTLSREAYEAGRSVPAARERAERTFAGRAA